MNKYCFELYENSNRGRVFLGYKTVHAEDNEQAYEKVTEKLENEIQAFQIYISQNES